MQHDLEENVSTISLPGPEVKYEPVPGSERHLLFESQSQDLQKGRQGRRPSPTVWRLTLMIGDGFLLLTMLTLVLLLAPYFQAGPRLSWNQPGSWHVKLVWWSVALVSWSVAVSILQAQDLACALSRFKSPLRAFLALLLMAIFWTALLSLTASTLVPSAAVLLLFLGAAAPVLGAWRILLAEFMNLPRFRRRGVVIGANTAGETIARELMGLERPVINILGYISEAADERTWESGPPVLGGKSALRDLVHSGNVDMIIMAIDYRTAPELFQEALEAAQLDISVVPMTMAYERITGKIPVEHVGDQWYVALPSERVVSPLYLCWRKAMDIAFGLCGTLILFVLLPVIALLIRLDSRGPIFYRQERLGRRGRKFTIYKFRSMATDAEQMGQAMWTAERDARVTRMGRFMRATHLDELPQAFNILRGDMSLIGPRPEREAFVTTLERSVPFYRCRLVVKPGLTGWAQVKYRYGRSDQDALIKLQYDLYYIKHQSLLIDVFILLKTVLEVLAYRGA